jgi:hypothetical protein
MHSVVEFSNTSKWVKELCGTINSVLERGRISSGEAMALRGRTVFAEGQPFGRTGRLCIDVLNVHAADGSDEKGTDEDAVALR